MYLHRPWAPYNLGTQRSATEQKTDFTYGKLLGFWLKPKKAWLTYYIQKHGNIV